MRRFILPGLVIGGVIALALFGVWWMRHGGVKFSAERAGEIKNEKLKIKNEAQETERPAEPEWVGRYILTPGPVKRELEGKQVLTSFNGRFVKWEPVPNSKDRYLILEADGVNIPKLRVVFEPKPEVGVTKLTQLSIIRPATNQVSIAGGVRELGDVAKLTEDTVDLVVRPGVWVKAILYRSQFTLKQDPDGHYYLSAITVKEN